MTPELLQGLRRLSAMIEELEAGRPSKRSAQPKLLAPVVIAIRRYTKSHRVSSWQDAVLELSTALEACLGPQAKEEIAMTLRTRAAHLLAHDDSEWE